ncbi:hypothetical protein PARMER_03471 [Parabacteroides merdae ATCC 43184]|nr:hypothetical protein PARMER_03471 [Parabacteroides merdae ATCC 43184]
MKHFLSKKTVFYHTGGYFPIFYLSLQCLIFLLKREAGSV